MRFNVILFLLFIGIFKCFGLPSDTTVVGKKKNGHPSGTWKYYDAKQQLIKVEKYRRGKRVQTYIFNSNGRVIERINRKGYVTKIRACGC
jgi:hypothetical protein